MLYVLETSFDDGATWSSHELSGPLVDPMGIAGSYFIDENIGLARRSGDNAWFKTDDGGSTWSSTPGVPGIWFAQGSPTRIFCFGTSAGTKTSVDSGATWEGLADGPVDGVAQLLFLDSLNGFSGSVYGIHYTADGGATWQLKFPTPCFRVAHRDPQKGVALGPPDTYMQTSLYRTEDQWSAITSTEMADQLDIPTVLFYDPAGGLFASDGSHMYCSHDDGDSWTLEFTLPSADVIRGLIRIGDHLIAYSDHGYLARKDLPL